MYKLGMIFSLFFLLTEIAFCRSFLVESSNVKFDFVKVNGVDEFVKIKSNSLRPTPLKLCFNEDGTIQNFSFYINSDESVGLVAEGIEVDEASVRIVDSSICRSNDEFISIKGNVEIVDSYIYGGDFDSEFGVPDESLNELHKIYLNGVHMRGGFKVYQSVSINNSTVLGDPIIFGNEGAGINITDSELSYKDLEEEVKGIYGSVNIYKVFGRGNFDIQSFSSGIWPGQESEIANRAETDFDISILEIGTKELPAFNGNIYIRNKANLYKGSFNGPILIDGQDTNGVSLTEVNLDFSELVGGSNVIRGSVSFQKVNVTNKNIDILGILNSKHETMEKRKGSKIAYPTKFKKKASEYAIALSGNYELNQPLILDGDITLKNQISVYGGVLKGKFTLNGNVNDGIQILKSSIDYSTSPSEENLLSGDYDISDSTIKGKLVGSMNISNNSIIETNFEIKNQGQYQAYMENANFHGCTQANPTTIILNDFVFRNFEIDGCTTVGGDSAYIYDSKFNGSNSVSGRINIRNVTMNPGTTIDAVNDDFSYLEGYPATMILNGSNHISGLFHIQTSLTNATISAAEIRLPGFMGVTISGDATIGSDVNLSGAVNIYSGSTVGDGVTIAGSYILDLSVCGNCFGVTVNLGSSITGPGTIIGGFMYFGNSNISNSQIFAYQPIRVQSQWSRMHNSTVINSTITGPFYYDGANIVDENIPGNWSELEKQKGGINNK